MAKYICTEKLITYAPKEVNGVKILKQAKVETIEQSPMTTSRAFRIISFYSGYIAPAGLWFDEKNRLESCRITFDSQTIDGKTTMKEIEIKKA